MKNVKLLVLLVIVAAAAGFYAGWWYHDRSDDSIERKIHDATEHMKDAGRALTR